MGFIDGLNKKYEEQKRAKQEWGLVLVKDKEVIEAHNQINFTGKVNTNASFQGFSGAYYEGCKDGEKFSISDKIDEGKAEDLLKITQ